MKQTGKMDIKARICWVNSEESTCESKCFLLSNPKDWHGITVGAWHHASVRSGDIPMIL